MLVEMFLRGFLVPVWRHLQCEHKHGANCIQVWGKNHSCISLQMLSKCNLVGSQNYEGHTKVHHPPMDNLSSNHKHFLGASRCSECLCIKTLSHFYSFLHTQFHHPHKDSPTSGHTHMPKKCNKKKHI